MERLPGRMVPFIVLVLAVIQLHAQEVSKVAANDSSDGSATIQAGGVADSGSSGQIKLAAAVDFVSRYIWRGADCGEAAAFQPLASIGYKNVEFGSWGSFALSSINGNSPFSEIDLYLKYYVPISSGNIAFAITDCHFPGPGVRFFNFDGHNGGTHTIELSGSFVGSDVLPLSLFTAVNVHNDTSHAFYVELGYAVQVREERITLFVGATTGASAWYAVSNHKFSVLNAGFTIARSLKLSATYSMPLSASFIVNPNQEKSYLVFKITL